MSDRTDLLAIVDDLYRGAEDDGALRSAFARLARRLRATTCALHTYDLAQRQASGVPLIDLEPGVLATYNAHFHRVNPWMQRGGDALRRGAVVTSHTMLPDEELVRTEFYADFLEPNDLWASIGAVIDRDGPVSRSITLLRPRRPGHFTTVEQRFLGELLPHLRTVFQLRARLAAAEESCRVGLAALDLVPVATLVVDASARVVSCNRAATRLLAAGDGLRLGHGGLAADDPRANAELRRAVAGAANAAVPPGEPPDRSIAVPRSSFRRAFLLRVLALPLGLASGAEAQPAALLVISDPEEAPRPCDRKLRRLYGLTDAEARLACSLAGGATLEEAAARAAISLNTARTHLKRIFLKTDTSRQAELVRLLASPALLAAPSGDVAHGAPRPPE